MRSSSSTIVDGSVCGLYRPTVSMNRPSRGERLSATTTRHTGSFFPPLRVSLMLTAIGRGSLAPSHQGAEVGHLALGEPAHQLAHLAELLDELVDLLDRGARAGGDALAAAALDDVGARSEEHTSELQSR